jgi:hypothetical protein
MRPSDLRELAGDIRGFLIDSARSTGGHHQAVFQNSGGTGRRCGEATFETRLSRRPRHRPPGVGRRRARQGTVAAFFDELGSQQAAVQTHVSSSCTDGFLGRQHGLAIRSDLAMAYASFKLLPT